MTNFEIVTIVLSVVAILMSLPAFIIAVIKIANEKKNYKKQYIINNLINLRDTLNKELTLLEDLNPEISTCLIFKRIESGEDFDYYNEIYKLYHTTSVIVSNVIIILSSYGTTEYSLKTIGVLQDILTDVTNSFKIVQHHKSRKSILAEYSAYKKCFGIQTYGDYKFNILMELTNVINHFIKDNICESELDEYFVQLKFKD